jgi:uncharacterized protein (TIGR03083 family)
MGLTRQQIIDGTLDEWRQCAATIRGLTPEQWQAPTRCDGWEVRDVAGHLVGLVSDVFAGTGFGSSTPDEQAAARRDHSPAEVADELDKASASAQLLVSGLDDAAWAGPSPAPGTTIGEGVRALWADAFVHRDDISAALGTGPLGGLGVEAAVENGLTALAKKGWSTTIDLSAADRHQLMLALTGRADPATVGLDDTANVYR